MFLPEVRKKRRDHLKATENHPALYSLRWDYRTSVEPTDTRWRLRRFTERRTILHNSFWLVLLVGFPMISLHTLHIQRLRIESYWLAMSATWICERYTVFGSPAE